MKLNNTLIFTALTIAALTAGAASAPAPAPAPVTAADIQELKDALAAQQRQIQALQAQLQAKEQAQQKVQSADLPAVPVAVTAPPAPQASDSTVTIASNLQETPTNKSQDS